MKRQLAVYAGLLVLGIGSVQAQTIYAGPGPFEPSAVLPPYEIMSIVRSTGLAPLTRPMRRGSYYVLVAVDRVGRQMRVVVDAELGDIVNMRPATAVGPFGSEPGRPVSAPVVGAPLPDTTAAYGARPGAENPGGYSAAPPRPAPATHATASPAAAAAGAAPAAAPPQTRLAVAEPALPPPPPLPRPRPKLALNEAPAPAAPTPPAAKQPAPAATSVGSQPPAAPDEGQIE